MRRQQQYEGKVAAWLSIPLSEGGEKRRLRRSAYRRIEAARIAGELARLFELRQNLTFGVISFYSAQVIEIWTELEKLGLAIKDGENFSLIPRLRFVADEYGRPAEQLQIGTVDSFQGKEFDVVILSLTRSNNLPVAAGDGTAIENKYGHLALVNRLCVSMSRQKRLLILAGDEAMATAVPTEEKELAPLRGFWELCGGHHGCFR